MDRPKADEPLDAFDSSESRTVELSNGLVATLFHLPFLDADLHNDVDEIEVDGWIIVRKNPEQSKKKVDSSLHLSIEVGWNNDPEDTPGLAHLLHHVITYYGSDKYSGENSGTISSSITSNKTFFHLNINKENFVTAADKFSELIAGFSVNEESVIQVNRQHNHQFCTFENLLDSLMGENLSALPKLNHDNPEEVNQLITELKKFKERHYSAHRMKLVFQSELPIDTLEKCFKESFSKVPNNNLPADDFSELHKFRVSSVNEEDFTKLHVLKAVYGPTLYLSWKVPMTIESEKYAPWEYLKRVINDTSAGSLNYYLFKKKWCEGKSSATLPTINFSDYSNSASKCSVVSLHFWLTEDGLEHCKDIIDAVFSMINKLRCDEPSENLFNDTKREEQLRFRIEGEEFYSKRKNKDVKFINSRMHCHMNPKHYFAKAPFIEFSPEAIKSCVDLLTPRSVNITLLDKLSEKYSKADIPESWISDWEIIKPLPEFKLPKLNPLLPSIDLVQNYDFAKNLSKMPKKVYQNEITEVWHSAFSEKSNEHHCRFNIDVISPLPIKTIESTVLLDLFNRVVQNSTQRIVYESICGSIIIEGQCYREDLPQILRWSIKHIVDINSHELMKVFFDRQKDILSRLYCENTFPKTLAKHLLLKLVDSESWLPNEKISALKKIDYDQFVKFAREFTNDLKFKCMVLGNMQEDDVKSKILEAIDGLDYKRVSTELPASISMIKEFYQIPAGNTNLVIFNETYSQDKNLRERYLSSAVHYYQIIYSPNSHDFIKLSTMIELLNEIISIPLEELRDENNFDDCFTDFKLFKPFLKRSKGSFGLVFQVGYEASSTLTPEHVDKLLDDFVETSINKLKNMTVDEFASHKSSLIKSTNRSPVNRKIYENFLLINAMRLNRDSNLDESNLLNSVISNLGLDEFHQFLDHNFVFHRKLCLHVIGSTGTNYSNDWEENCSNTITILSSDTENDKISSHIDTFRRNFSKYGQPNIEFTSCADFFCQHWY